MAIIYTYPVVTPTSNDLVLGTDVDAQGKPTKNFTVQSIIDLVTVTGNDLQAVLNNGNTATQNIVLTGNMSATQFTDGTITIGGGVASGFTTITSTNFAGNITGVVKNGSSIQGNVTGVTQAVGTSDTRLATTKFVMDKVDPSILTFIGTSGGNQTVNLAAQTFSILGTANQIESVGTAQKITFRFPTAGVTLPDGSVATTQALTDNSTKVATTAFVHGKNNAQDLDFIGDTGTSSVLLNSQALDFEGTTNQIVTAVTAQKVKFSLPSSVTISGTYTGATFAGDLLGTVNTATTGTTQSAGDDSTKIATTAYVDNAAGSKTLEYAGDATGPFALNLTNDDLEFNGDSNITITAAAVTGNKGIVTVDLNNDVTITGTSKAGTFTTTAGTATWTTTVLAGFTSITSTLFVGALTGNASTATALASSGAISLSGDTTSTGGPHTYTSGGAVTIPTTIANTTVTAKTLLNLPTPTSTAITASDTILAAMAKLQGQITGIPQGLVYKGTWNATTNTPTLASSTGVTGEFYIVSVAGNTNLNGITDWQVGDWAIFVEVGATDTWQKIDNSQSITGSGATNKITKWTAPTVLGTGLIEDDGTNVTIGNSGNLIVEGNTTLGNADTDSTTVKGLAIFEERIRINEGISLGVNTYGTAGQVLTSGGGSASVNTWTTPTTGTVTSVTAGTGITIGGTAADPTVAIDYLGTDNAILSAPQENGIATTDTVWFSDATDDNIKKTTVANLIALDGARSLSATLAVGNTSGANEIIMADDKAILFGTGSDSFIKHTGSAFSLINDVGNTTFTNRGDDTDIIFQSDDGSGGTATYMTIDGGSLQTKFFKQTEHQDSVIGGYGNGTDLQLFHNATDSFIDNYTGNLNFRSFATDKDIVFQSDDGSGGVTEYLRLDGSAEEIYFSKSTLLFDNVKAKFGNGSDLQIYHDGGNSFINNTGTGSLLLKSNSGGIYLKSIAGDTLAQFINDGAVSLYYDNSIKFATTSTGVTVTGAGTFTGNVNIATGSQLFFDNGGNTYISEDITDRLRFFVGGSEFMRFTEDTADTITFYKDSTFTGNVEIDGNLTVDGHIIHGGGGGGTGKGGQFTKLYTTGNAGVAGVAFTIDRAVTGTMVFDVMFTGDTSTATSVAKKYTVIATYGATAPIYNKILDSGPDANGGEFGVAFADDTSNTKIKCTITPFSINTQKIGITIDLGFGQNDATVVMN
jgi:hypothetical protein